SATASERGESPRRRRRAARGGARSTPAGAAPLDIAGRRTGGGDIAAERRHGDADPTANDQPARRPGRAPGRGSVDRRRSRAGRTGGRIASPPASGRPAGRGSRLAGAAWVGAVMVPSSETPGPHPLARLASTRAGCLPGTVATDAACYPGPDS